MTRVALILCALTALIGVPAAAQDETAAKPDAKAQAYLATASRNESDLSLQTRQTRDQLIHDPSQIATVVEAAGAANATTKLEIELGVVLALEYLKRFDSSGYQALSDYLKAHPDNPVVADINEALNAPAQVGTAAGGLGGGAFSSGGGRLPVRNDRGVSARLGKAAEITGARPMNDCRVLRTEASSPSDAKAPHRNGARIAILLRVASGVSEVERDAR